MPTYDVDIMRGVANNGAANPITFDFSGKAVYGTQKAVQRFTLFLLTRKGSVKGNPDFGSDLYKELQTVNVTNKAELQGIFDSAFHSCVSYEKEQVQAGTIDSNESVSAYAILSFNLTDNTIAVVTQLTIGDNTQTITLPIPLNG